MTVLHNATPDQGETFERLKAIFGRRPGNHHDIKFLLIGGAACREYGLGRQAKDLDIVLSPYEEALAVLVRTREFPEGGAPPDPTGRTCSKIDLKTLVPIDFLKGGIRINDMSRLNLGIVHDRLPIPQATEFASIASLPNLIGIKVSTLITGLDVHRLKADFGLREMSKLQQDLDDVKDLIRANRLGRDLVLGDAEVDDMYKSIYDDLDPLASLRA